MIKQNIVRENVKVQRLDVQESYVQVLDGLLMEIEFTQK
jgi:hypothetical protein